MSNHHNALKQQLKKVLNNINKKYTTLRKQISKVIQVFENSHIPIFPYQVLFGLFKILSETGSVRSIISFFPFFQLIIAMGYAEEEMSKQILTVLIQLRSMPKFQSIENQNKLQQLLIQLISKQSIHINSINFSQNLINALSSLRNSTNKALWQKQANAVSQITQHLIASYQQQKAQGKAKVLLGFFNDLVILGKKQSPSWYSQIPDPFIAYFCIIETLDSKFILETREQWKESFGNVLPFIRKKIIQTSQTSQPSTNVSHIKSWQLPPENKLILMFKVACKYSKIFFQGFEILEEIIKLITEKANLQWKIIAFECISYLFSESRWMYGLLRSNFAQLFNFLLTTEFNILKALFSEYKDRVDLTVNQLQFPKIFTHVLPDFNITEFPFNSEIKIILKNLQEITNSLYGIYTDVLKVPLHKKYEGDPPLYKTYKFCQKTVFEIIKAVFPKEMNEQILQGILKIAEKFINISGSFGDYNVTIMYMKLICKHCLPAQFKMIGRRHVQINKMILSTVNCLGGLLNTACWVIVWKALENYSQYYNKYLLSKQHHQPQRQTDVQILYKTMDSIFTQSPNYPDEYLLNIINSLVEVTYQCLENNYSDETKKIFSFERIQQVYKINLFRIPLMWPSLSSSLLCITTSKVAYFRISALNLLNSLIPMSLYHLNNHPENFTTSFNAQNYQTLILQPWTSLVKCQFQELKNQMIVALNKIIIDYGHILTHGWESILHVVSSMRDLKSLQSIVQTFLDKVDQKIMDILLTIDLIERELHDTNQKYLCLTLIWAIGDYSHKHNHPKVLRKIYNILLQPDEMFSLGTEARHSSFYIFAELIVHNCLENSCQFWSEVFNSIENFCTFGVNRSLESKDKKLAQDAIKNILINMIKIYRIFFMVSQQMSQLYRQWKEKQLVSKKLQFFYKLCANILKFRQTEVYQTLIKQMKEILFAKTDQSLQLTELVTFIEALTEAYIVDNETKILKCLITYLPTDLYEMILKCAPLINGNLGTLYKLIQKIFLLRLEAEEKDIKLAQARIFFEEKHFNEFYKKFHRIVVENYPQVVPEYMEKFVKILHHLLLYQDYGYLSKMFQYSTGTVIKFQQICSEGLVDLLSKIIFIKFDAQWINKYGQSKEVPIWYISSQQLIKLCFQFMNRKAYDSCLRIYRTLSKSLFSSQSELILKTSASVECISFYHENEITISNFLIDNFFYNSTLKQEEVTLQDFMKILQKIVEKSKGLNEKDPKNWSKNFYELLFKIANKKTGQQSQFVQSRQILVIKALLFRVLETFDCFLKSQLKQSSQNSSIVAEVKFVLKKLILLECQESIFSKQNLLVFATENLKCKMKAENILLQNSKCHLFLLNSCFLECIKSKNEEVRALVADIYEEKNKIMLQI